MQATWEMKKLGEICEKIKKEKAPVGTIPYIEIGNVDVNSKKVIFNEKGAVKGSIFAPENSILISRVRPARGAVTFIDKKTAVSSAFTIIKPKPEYNPKLLFYFLAWNRKFFDYLGERQKGTNYPSVREKDVLEFEISFPGNEEEQQKIVRILDTIQEAIDIQEKIIEKAKELKKSLMAELFKYGGPSFRKGRKLKKTEIGEIPEDWEVVRLGEVVNTKDGIKRGPWGGSIKKEIFVSSGYKVYEQGNVLNNDFERGEYFISETKFLELKSFEVRSGDILVTAAGSLGAIAIVPENIKPGIINQALIRIRLDETKMTKKFFKYLFDKIIATGMIEKYSHGATLKNFASVSILKNLKIPLPPLPEQREIAEILQTIDQKIEIEKRKKELYEELFKTMLNKIMNQEIDVEKIEV
jgi:type I restriction enzyme S subunit